jgi:molybdate transport system ATP-binding protein
VISPSIKLEVVLRLDDFDLQASLSLGSSTAILGASGSGKTSLLECIAGLREAVGRIEFDGEVLLDAGSCLPPEHRGLGYVPQDSSLFPHLDVRSNLLFGRRGRAPSEAFEEIVEELELAPLLSRAPARLSGGEARRVALGRALLAEPRLLLLDEPTAGLDPVRAARARRAIACLVARRELPLLLVTHSREEALALCDEAVLMERGRVLRSGPIRETLRGDLHGGVNVQRGSVTSQDPEGGITLVQLGGGPLLSIPHAPDLSRGQDVVLALDAEDLLVSRGDVAGLSARNSFVATVTALRREGGTVAVDCAEWTALLTASAANSLELEEGASVHLIAKTHGWRLVSA